MRNINPIFNDRARYTLQHKVYGSEAITEPIGWQTDEKEYVRNKKYHGVFTKFSNNLKFINSGSDFIRIVYEVYGINEEVRLIKDEKHPHTDEWLRSYDGFLDLSTYEIENKEVSVKFNSSGLQQLLKTRESEKIEIERTKTIDGQSISNLITKNVLLEGRGIFLRSNFEVLDSDNSIELYNSTNGRTRGETIGVPLNLSTKSHDKAQSVIPNTNRGDNTHERNARGDIGNMFFLNSDRERDITISIDLSFKFNKKEHDDINFATFIVRLAVYKDGADLNYKEGAEQDLFQTDDILGNDGKTIKKTLRKKMTLKEGESLSLFFNQLMDGKNGKRAHLRIKCTDIKCNLSVEEDSATSESNTKAIMAHELGQRLLHVVTGDKNALYSDVLGRKDIGYSSDGLASFTGMAHGFWIRGFDKLPDNEDNKYKGFSTSFKDFMESLSAVWNLGLGIEKIGFKERIRIEDLKYFYNDQVTIKLPTPVKVKRSVAKDFYYSSIEVGYAKGWENEEAMGLDEYNTQTKLTTAITRIKKTYTRLSKYIAGTYPKEFIRRKPKSKFPTQDHRYDKEIFLLDLKRLTKSTFAERKWNDDFDKEPIGVFSPKTATNLRLSPLNMLLRHGWIVSSGLTKHNKEYIRYASSEGNSKLSTKLKNSKSYSENGDILNSDLQRPRFIPEWLEFEHIVDFDIIQQIEGFTIIKGKQVPNFYGLVQFINDENNKVEKGYLFNLKPNGKGKWKLLKANQ